MKNRALPIVLSALCLTLAPAALAQAPAAPAPKPAAPAPKPAAPAPTPAAAAPAPAAAAPEPAAAAPEPVAEPVAPAPEPAAPAPEPALLAPTPAPLAPENDAASPSSPEPASSGKDRGAIVAGGKFGGVATLAGFGPNITGALEVGYIFPWLKRGLGVVVDVSYAAPVASGTEPDGSLAANAPRVPGRSYDWKLYQKQLTILPMVMYRYTGLGKIVPYIGAGPRIVMLQSVTEGMAGGATILETKEESTKVGIGAPLGAEYLIGPGAALAELMFQYNPIDHRSTGSSSLTSFTLWVGYRFML